MENHHVQWENPSYMAMFNRYVKFSGGMIYGVVTDMKKSMTYVVALFGLIGNEIAGNDPGGSRFGTIQRHLITLW